MRVLFVYGEEPTPVTCAHEPCTNPTPGAEVFWCSPDCMRDWNITNRHATTDQPPMRTPLGMQIGLNSRPLEPNRTPL